MTRTSRTITLTLSVALGVLLLACGAGDSSGPVAHNATPAAPIPPVAAATPEARTAYPLSIPTSDGRTVSIVRAPERIVSLSPGQTEILYAIGAGGVVVGTDRFSDFPDAVKALPKIDYSNPNIEALAALRPDLVIAATRQRTLVPTLEQAGMKVVLLEEPATVAAVMDRIRLTGQIADRQGPANELAGRLQEQLSGIIAKLQGAAAGPRVYHEIDPKLFSAAPNSFVGDIYTVLKAQNIAQSGASAFPQLTAEAIIRADPEVIVLADGQFPGGTPDETKRRPGWAVISAVRNNRVYAVDDNLVSRPGPRVVDGVEQVAKLLYPDLFK